MGKRIYSLVLSDILISKADELAAMKNTSRSCVVNEILAEYFGFTTAERRIQDVFTALKEYINHGDFRVLLSPSDTSMSVKSYLRYKYNPAVNYSVVLYRKPSTVFGELRVIIRTQNKDFIFLLNSFFSLWQALEESLRSEDMIEHEIYDCKYTRKFALMQDILPTSGEALGGAIAKYLQLFHDAIQLYIENPDNPQKIKTRYMQYLDSANTII